MFFLMFTGQGSQQLNMGKDFFDKYQIARDVMNRCEDALCYKLSEKIFCDDATELNKTIFTQPAILANAMMIYNTLLDCNSEFQNRISYIAGHSVGEYNALCANGVFSIEDGVSLLSARAKFMEDSCPAGTGGMAAMLRVNHDILNDLIQRADLEDKICAIANDNGAEQIVISGDISAVDKVCSIAKEKGVKAIKLNVSGPFHSPLMEKAAKNMENELVKYKFNTQSLISRVISNVTTEVFPDDECKIKDLLVQQIISPVRWRETILNAFYKNGIKHFVEIGPKATLTGLLKNTLPQDQINFDFIGSVGEMEKFLENILIVS